MLGLIDQMGLDMVLHDLSHQAGDGAPHPCDLVQHGFAAGLSFNRPLNGLYLTLYSLNPRKEALLLADRMHAPP